MFPGRGGVTVCAERFGVSPQYWRDWETGKRKPGARNQQKLAEFFTIPLAELTGPGVPSLPAHEHGQPFTALGIPVISLAECGVSGWYSANPIAVRASLPSHSKMFAVLAVGKSMLPDGIAEGYLLYCDPTIEAKKNDAVFIKTADGKATVKRFLQWEDGWLQVLGWLDPDWQGIQKPFVSKFPRDFVVTMCPVVLVQRRA